MRNKGQPRLNRGQSLTEIVMALGVVGIALLAILALATTSNRNINFSKAEAMATRYTQEAIEALREERDRDWNVFITNIAASSSGYCVVNIGSPWTSPGNCGDTQFITGTNFRRDVDFVRPNNYTVNVTVVTSWTDAQGVHDARSTTQLTNWK